MPSFALDRQLTSIELPTGLTSLGDGAFSGCSSMMSIDRVSSAVAPRRSLGRCAYRSAGAVAPSVSARHRRAAGGGVYRGGSSDVVM